MTRYGSRPPRITALTSLALIAACTPLPTTSVRALPQPADGTVFTAIRVFDGDRVLGPRDVLVVGPSITEIGPANTLTPSADTRVVQCEDCTLMPGLIDLHVHLEVDGAAPWHSHLPQPLDNGRAYLFAGVTTVLSAKGGPGQQSLERARAKGVPTVPHVYSSGPSLTGDGSHPIPLLRDTVPWPAKGLAVRMQPAASSAEEARAEVRRVAQTEAPPFFKIYFDSFPQGSPHMEPWVMQAAAQEAIAQGMRPVVHAGTAQDAVDAAEAGAALLMHAPFGSLLTPRQVERIAATDVAFLPTLRAFAWPIEQTRGEISDFERDTVAPAILEAFTQMPDGYAERDGMGQWMQSFGAVTDTLWANTELLIDAGVPMLVGTDSGVSGVFPGSGLHAELAALVYMGVSPIEVLQASTARSAAFLDPTGSFGRVAPGQRADLLLVQGDPSVDIEAVDAIRGVWIDGVELERIGLDEQVVQR